MLSVRACQSFLLITALAVTPALASRTHRAPTSGRHHHHKAHTRRAAHHVVKGQRGIDPERAREIQTALIRQNYMTGTPSGQWDAETESAMLKYQADHGWQTRLTPDSRALIMLGLGPDHSAGTAPTDATAAAASSAATPAAAPNTLASTHVIQN
jgi:hypothetical protein